MNVKCSSVLTPHRLSVGILIMEISKFRNSVDPGTATNGQQHRISIRNSCILLLRLIQSPDLTLEDLLEGITSIGSRDLEEQCGKMILQIVSDGIEKLLDTVNSIKQILLLDNNLITIRTEFIARNSVIGLYLRRLILHFDQLSFSEITTFFDSFKEYVAKCNECANHGNESDNVASKKEICDEGSFDKEWTKRQAELFIATQSALIVNNEQDALSPKALHENIKSLLKSNPQIASAHFLSYLNYMRVKEFCGAIESLYHCFDTSPNCSAETASNSVAADEKSRNYRYAVLNLAILHYKFGNKEQALVALNEAIKIAQETNDNVCLQHAHAWIYCLTAANRNKLMQHSIIKSLDLNMSHVMSLGIQAYVQYAALSTGNPKQVFVSLTRSDIINCQNSQGHHDLVATSYTQKSAIWLFYGKSEMASLWSQLLAFASSGSTAADTVANCGESYALALTNLAGILHLDGEYNISNKIMAIAKERFPDSDTWMLCRNLFNFRRLLHNCKFTEAEQAASKVSVLDRYEGSLCKCQLYVHTGDYTKANAEVNQILNRCKNVEADIRMDVQVRAMIALADVQIATCLPTGSPSGVLGLLNSSLAYANDYHMQYLAALAQLRIAHVLLLTGMPSQAEAILQRCLVQILAHGGAYDCARVLFLQVLCNVALSSEEEDDRRTQVLQECASSLEKVKQLFEKVEAHFRVKDVLLVQVKIYHELGLKKQRNSCALEHQILLEEHPNTISSVLFKVI